MAKQVVEACVNAGTWNDYTGGVMTSSQAVGTNLRGYESWTKPEFARQPVIRDNFFRSTGVLRSVY